MTKEKTEQEKVVAENSATKQPQAVGIKDATEEQLKAAAFDIDQQIKQLQRQYNEVYKELAGRQNGTTKE